MGTSVHESTVVEWKKAAGDRVAKGEVILSAESDKVEFEVESPADGVLKEILVGPETTVPVGEVLALLETEQEVADQPGEEAKPPRSARKAPGGPPKESEWVAPVAPLPPRERPQPPASSRGEGYPAPSAPAGSAWLSPRVQRIAAQHGLGLDVLTRIPGTGAGGRVTARDVERFVREGAAAPGAGAAGAPPLLAPSFRALAAEAPSGERERREPFSRVRKRIAQNLARSAREIPQVTIWTEADMSRVVSWREANKEAFRRKHGAGLTYTPFFALAILAALRDPANARFNAACEEDALIVKRYVNLGLAVDAPDGLLVPVLHGADGLGFAELALRLEDLSARARSGKLSPEEVKEGTVTLTNFGASGALTGNPLLNPPEVAIVGTGAIAPRVAALPGGAIGVRPLMTLALTFDHRANDGMAAARFAASIRAALEGIDLSRVEY